MGRYFCIRNCGHYEDGCFEDVAMCSENCLAAEEMVCSRCNDFSKCSKCGEEVCSVCLEANVEYDGLCIACVEIEEDKEKKRNAKKRRAEKDVKSEINKDFKLKDEKLKNDKKRIRNNKNKL